MSRAGRGAFEHEPSDERRLERRALVNAAWGACCHGLGTPLNVIGGHASLLLRATDDPALVRHAEAIAAQVRRLADHLKAVTAELDALRPPTKGTASCLEAIVAACARVAHLAEARDVRVETAVVGPESTAACDPLRLVLLLEMLLERVVSQASPGDVIELRLDGAGEEAAASGARAERGEYLALVVRHQGDDGEADDGEPRGSTGGRGVAFEVVRALARDLGGVLSMKDGGRALTLRVPNSRAGDE
jgi:two-component system NtrC family sensor kinase